MPLEISAKEYTESAQIFIASGSLTAQSIGFPGPIGREYPIYCELHSATFKDNSTAYVRHKIEPRDYRLHGIDIKVSQIPSSTD